MKLLVATQAVDLDDPVLGFFHRWLEALAPECESIHVICLKEGRHVLPPNVYVHSLGKEQGKSLLRYISRFYRYVLALHSDYDSVFVHMNEEYVLMCGFWWRLWGKRIVMWRNHKKGTLRTRFAARLCNTICYTSPESFVASYPHAVVMPIGIDTDFFSPGTERNPRSILFLGRLDPVKRCVEFVDALNTLRESGEKFTVDIVGDNSAVAMADGVYFSFSYLLR